MPIITYSCKDNAEIERTNENRVLKIRKYRATRNCSDTLDYSDYREVENTEALVYYGRVVPEAPDGYVWSSSGPHMLRSGTEVPLNDRFGWVDCTNLFADRNGSYRVPKVDELAMLDGELLEDFENWEAHTAGSAKGRAFKVAELAAERAGQKAQVERNRPVKGKPMVVFKGRKVPIGTTGVVAFISEDRVLLKQPHEWQDRKANGIWVAAANLKAQ